MRGVLPFLFCAALSIAGVSLWVMAIMPRGEGGFAFAKALPTILICGSGIIFCATWFPTNLAVFLWSRFVESNQPAAREFRPVVVFSGCLFVLCITLVGAERFLAWRLENSPQAHMPSPPPRQVELKDVKALIDSYCARERNGEKPTATDGEFSTLMQVLHSSTPEVINYAAGNLQDDSGLLWVLAGLSNCPTNLFPRFLSILSTQKSLAGNRATPASTLETLSHSTNRDVRVGVAINASTPEEVLQCENTILNKKHQLKDISPIECRNLLTISSRHGRKS